MDTDVGAADKTNIAYLDRVVHDEGAKRSGAEFEKYVSKVEEKQDKMFKKDGRGEVKQATLCMMDNSDVYKAHQEIFSWGAACAFKPASYGFSHTGQRDNWLKMQKRFRIKVHCYKKIFKVMSRCITLTQ